MAFRKRFMAITAAGGLAALGIGVGPVTHAHAATLCDDGSGNEWKEIPITTSGPTLAIEIGDGGTPLDPHIGVCFSTNSEAQDAAGQPAVANTAIVVDAVNPASNDGFSTGAAVLWGTNSDVKAGALAGTTPTFSLSPGPVGTTGDLISVLIPFTVCVGPCTGTGAGLNPTGLLIGQLTPTPEPGIGVGYQLSTLQVYVNGTLLLSTAPQLAGAYVNPFGAVAESLNLSQGGPCFFNECVPDGYVETTGTSVAGIQVVGIPVNINVPKECVYSNPNGSCP